MKKTGNAEFMQALDYILNRAALREIDALEAAVERRRRELSAETGVFSLDPERAAKEMTSSVQSSIERTMDAVRDTFRGFALDLLDKETPELSPSEKEKLVDAWIPKKDEPSFPLAASLANGGKVNGIPCDMMREMALQFAAYSLGRMPAEEENALRRDVGDWPAAYWRRFPQQLQRLIKALVSGKLPQDDFNAALKAMLE